MSTDDSRRVVVARQSRLLDGPIDKVWEVLTRADHLEGWFCDEADVDLHIGGPFDCRGASVWLRGGGQRIVTLEPKREIAFLWPFEGMDVLVTWRIEPILDQTRILIEEAMLPEHTRAAHDARPAFNFRLCDTYTHHLEHYCRLGYAPARVDCNPVAGDEIEIAMELPVSPEAAFAALVEPQKLDAWLTHNAKVDLRIGGSISYGWPGGHDEALPITDYEPGRQIRYAWNDKPGATPPSVTLSVESLEGGSRARIRFVNSGFIDDPEGFFGHYWGWQFYLGRLAMFLVTGVPNPKFWPDHG